MEKIKLDFSARVIRLSPEGFSAILNDGYIVKFKDIKLKHIFQVGDEVQITIESIEKPRNDVVVNGRSVIYIIVSSFISNGFLFKDVREPETFFWRSTRGMLTHKIFEKQDLFLPNSMLKITIFKS